MNFSINRIIYALVILCIAVIIAIVVISVTNTNGLKITIILGFIAPTITALLAFLKSQDNANKIEQVHSTIKNRLEPKD